MMFGRVGWAPCCDKANVKKGPWAPEEDLKLKEFIDKYGTGGNWIALPQKAGLKRCGKSCRLRWLNYLRPNIKHGEFSEEEDRIICTLFASIGSRWSIIAAQLPGRTDNDIKNYWNTKLKKKLMIGNMALNNNPLNHRKLPPYPPPPPPPQLPSFYNYSPLIKSFSCLETSLIPPPNPIFHHHNSYDNFDFTPSSVPTSNGSSLNLQPQESFLFSAMQQHYYPPLKEGFLVFGSGDQASCSSNNSDGSCSQISSHGKGQIKQEENMGLFGLEENQRFIVDYGNNNGGDPNENHMFPTTTATAWSTDDRQKYTTTKGYFGNSGGMSPLDYGLEEVKQLITNNSSSSLLFNDENKTAEEEEEEEGEEGENTMYYYY
ncbi:hypothetical protein RHSIM_Rhsim13G0099300 [Rhododendron simsii]|uniref:Uncharacterized protein n=1 Tax=Rhododendron simsii TaxID=118357 RepID=A0A834FZM6_RHOSS|nr:hypothetical protein RHSIM_Rhsim13G0099300 [Rhododendron simsii]